MAAHDDDFTGLLIAWRQGDSEALAQVAEIAYRELRDLAVARLRQESRACTLQPTELVHEMFLRLLGADVPWRDRSHFYALAARTMRRVLVDQARARQRQKRGEHPVKVTLHEWPTQDAESASNRLLDMLALDQALTTLESMDADQTRVVELYFFAGLTFEEIARLTERSSSAVHRLVRSGQAWLYQQLQPQTRVHMQPRGGDS